MNIFRGRHIIIAGWRGSFCEKRHKLGSEYLKIVYNAKTMTVDEIIKEFR